MSLINDLLTSISKNPGITAQELAEELQQVLARVRNNLYVSTDLVTTKRDDVTRRPGYHLTAAGKARLKAGARSGDAKPIPKPAEAATPATESPPAPLGNKTEPISIHDLQGQIAALQHDVAMLQADKFRLQEDLRKAQHAAPASTPAAPVGYLIAATKRKPRRFTSADTARTAALKAVRAGAARADVFALIPAGTARRGVEWTDPQEP